MASLFQRMKKNATGLYRDPLKEQSHEILLHRFGQIFRLRNIMFPYQLSLSALCCGSGSETFSRIRIRIRKISFRMPGTDPDPLVRGTDPDPFIIKQK